MTDIEKLKNKETANKNKQPNQTINNQTKNSNKPNKK